MGNVISCLQDDTRDIFLDGIVARNRALNGDVVVVQILPQDQWKVARDMTAPGSGLLTNTGSEGVSGSQAGEVRFRLSRLQRIRQPERERGASRAEARTTLLSV